MPKITTLEQADAAMRVLFAVQRHRSLAKTAHLSAVAYAASLYEKSDAPLRDAENDIINRLTAWATLNRDALTEGGRKKTVALRHGQIRWIQPVTDVTTALSGSALDALLRRLEARGCDEFLQRHVSLNLAGIQNASQDKLDFILDAEPAIRLVLGDEVCLVKTRAA